MVVAIAEVVHLTSSHPVLIVSSFLRLAVTVQQGWKQRDFCYGCFRITHGWVTVITCISGLHVIDHLDLNCEPAFHGFLCSHETGAQNMRLLSLWTPQTECLKDSYQSLGATRNLFDVKSFPAKTNPFLFASYCILCKITAFLTI